MTCLYFLEGAVIGFSLAAPIGPVGILRARRTLEHGARYGLVIGVSAASCDMVISIFAAFGITLVSDFITLEQYWIRLVGGIILLVMGYTVCHARPLKDKVVTALAAAKAAAVTLLEIRLAMALGGKAFVTLTGDMAPVQAAVSAGRSVIAEAGVLVNAVVISRPHPSVYHEVI